MTAAATDKVRLDKWLWAARFFKTRSQAAEAVSGGKVHANEQRVKPARAVNIGDTLEIQRGYDRYTIIVQALSDRRGPAKEAVTLYEETADSISKREAEADKRRLSALASPQSQGPERRPSKRGRRQIVRFTRKSDA